MKRRIIIPAAGKATRFHGLPKELLPTDMHECGLSRAVRLAKELDGTPVVVTNRDKQVMHERILRVAEYLNDCVFVKQETMDELWGAIRLGLERDCPGGLVLPDTVTSIAATPRHSPAGAAVIQFGTFETTTPERYSVVPNATPFAIFTKANLPAGSYRAWGMVLWSAHVTNFFLDNTFDHYDRAFEAAARTFGHATFPLSYYYDLGSFASYLSFLAITHLPQP